MDRFRALETFIAIAEAGSLTAAAKALGTSQPSVVRTLAAYERQLGVRLFHRTTRRITLTDEGHRHLAHAREILVDAKTGKARGVAFIDSETGRNYEAAAKVVVDWTRSA